MVKREKQKLHIIADLVNRAIIAQKLTEGRRHDWKEMITEWLEKKFLREYHIRSIIEAIIYLKCIVGSAVQDKNILAEIILNIFNAVCKGVSINYAPKSFNTNL